MFGASGSPTGNCAPKPIATGSISAGSRRGYRQRALAARVWHDDRPGSRRTVVLARFQCSRSGNGPAGRPRNARRIPQPDDHAAGAGRRFGSPHGRERGRAGAQLCPRAAEYQAGGDAGPGRQLRAHAATRRGRRGRRSTCQRTGLCPGSARCNWPGHALRHHAWPPQYLGRPAPARQARFPCPLRSRSGRGAQRRRPGCVTPPDRRR